MTTGLTIVAMLTALVALAEVLRRVRAVAWFVFLILPPALLPLWIRSGDQGPVFWGKIILVLWGVVWLLACRDTRLGGKMWSLRVGTVIMALNIAELMARDLYGGTAAGWLNAGAGAVLIVSMPGATRIRIDPRRDFLWDIPYGWIVSYTLWNWTFVYLNFSAGSGRTIALLGAPLVIGLWDRQRWLQARAFTLGASLLLTFTWHPLSTIGSTPAWYTPWFGVLVAGSALGSGCLYAAFALRQTMRRRALSPTTA
jgi:hypothetical protein